MKTEHSQQLLLLPSESIFLIPLIRPVFQRLVKSFVPLFSDEKVRSEWLSPRIYSLYRWEGAGGLYFCHSIGVQRKIEVLTVSNEKGLGKG